MNRILLYFFIGILFELTFVRSSMAYFPGNTTEKEYSVDNIPKNLIKDANAIIRKKHVSFRVSDDFHAVKRVTYAVTIFKRHENHYGELVLNYDNNLIEIEDLEGVIYDQFGEEVRELEDEDVKDYSAYKGYTLFDENRVKVVNLYYDRYPYTVEFYYEIGYNGFINWPTWYSQFNSDPIESNRFEITLNSDQNLRYWSNSDSIKHKIVQTGSSTTFRWQVNNVPAMSKYQEKSDLYDVATIVKTAPNSFEIEGYDGKMSSWKEFGKWFAKLSNGRSNLTSSAKDELGRVVKGNLNDKEITMALYEHLQSKVRYVSVQLGIGGWQPFDANYVYEREYGDCKALSNYMVSMLKLYDIESYPVLINNGHKRNPFIEEFPSNQFNHVIVCVPLKNDTVWLECTSQIKEFGNIGWSNENRKALMITPEGGVIVKTPNSSSTKNVEEKNVRVKFSGHVAEVKSKVILKGESFNDINSVFDEEDLEKQEKWIKNQLTVPKIELQNYDYNKIESETAMLAFNLSLPRYAKISGKRFFFNPNLMERNTYVPEKNENRVSPIRFYHPFSEIDTILYEIPVGYEIESLPKNENIVNSFGKFITTINSLSDTQILYTRRFEIKKYIIEASEYLKYRDFYSKIAEADRKQIVLKKL